MRNLLEYPITHKEMIEFLDEIAAWHSVSELKNPQYGNMTLLLVEKIKECVLEVERFQSEKKASTEHKD
jgi:hypothetical protein